MKINNIFEIQLEIIINMKLYERKIIDEYSFSKVNNILLKKLKTLQNTQLTKRGKIHEI